METIEIDLDDDLLWDLFMLAHKRDITLNQLITDILKEAIEKELPIGADGCITGAPAHE